MPIFLKKLFNFCCFVDNEATLSKFANKAYCKFLKNLKEKPECVPEELFSATFGEEKVKGKRSRLETNKLKESREQEEEMSPKKKKKTNKKNTSPKKSCTSETVTTNKTLAKEKAEKKKTEDAAAYKCSLHMSDVLTQFIEEDSDAECNSPAVSIQPSPGAAPPESAFGLLQSSRKSTVSTGESGVPTSQHLQLSPAVRPAPSQSSIITSPKKSTVSTGTCRSALHVTNPNYIERTEEIKDDQPQPMPRPILPLIPTFETNMPETSMLETWTLCKQSMGTNIEESKKIPGKTSLNS